MLNWQGWADNWLGWGSASGVTTSAGGGGDRGVILFREEKLPKPPKFERPPEIEIRAHTEQAPQESRGKIDTSTNLRFATEQESVIELSISVTAGKVQGQSVSVKPRLQAARIRVQSEGGANEVKAIIEIE